MRNSYGFYNVPIIYEAGITSDLLDPVYAHQNKTQWCWSASISMALRYYGFEVDQKMFARNICGLDVLGNPKNCSASPYDISESLNIKGNDVWGNAYSVIAPLRKGVPDIIELINQLDAGRPVIISYYNSDYKSSHAVVVTGCKYEIHEGTVWLTHLYIRDPWIDVSNVISKGRKVVSNLTDFYYRIHSYWFVDVYEYPGFNFAS
jgi:hypothetical protein